MPELPEVETISRSLNPQVQGRFLRNCTMLAPKTLQAGRDLWTLLEGARVLRARRRAKLLLLDVAGENGDDLVMGFHLKMTGQLFVHELDVKPGKHTKLTFDLYAQKDAAEPEARLFFDDARTFGYCRVMRPETLQEWPFWARLGLEPLERQPTELADRLQGKKGRIKGVLLDQTVICGIGNIYADESLFRAGIRPDAKTEKVSRGKLEELAAHIREVLKESIEACGSSIRDYRDADGNAGAFQNSFMVYGRAGERCKVCGTELTGCRVAGRGTVYCRKCQYWSGLI